MLRQRRRLPWLAIPLLIGGCNVAAPRDVWDRFPGSEACVAYIARKTLLMVAELPVVGMSCNVAVTTTQNAGGRSVSIEMPVASFRSGNGMRDTAVLESIGGKERSPLTYQAALSESSVPTQLDGKLMIRGRVSPLVVSLTRLPNGDGRAEVETSFSALGLAPPRLAGGAVVDVHDRLKLVAQIPAAKMPPGVFGTGQ